MIPLSVPEIEGGLLSVTEEEKKKDRFRFRFRLDMYFVICTTSLNAAQ